MCLYRRELSPNKGSDLKWNQTINQLLIIIIIIIIIIIVIVVVIKMVIIIIIIINCFRATPKWVRNKQFYYLGAAADLEGDLGFADAFFQGFHLLTIQRVPPLVLFYDIHLIPFFLKMPLALKYINFEVQNFPKKVDIQVRSLVSQLIKSQNENIWASSTISKILAKKRLGEGGMGSITKFYNCLFYTIEFSFRGGDSVQYREVRLLTESSNI